MCAIISNDQETLVNIARFFLTDYQFTTDAYRMFAVLGRACRGSVSWYISGPTQNFLLRQIRTMDYSLTPTEDRTVELDAARGPYTAVDQDGKLIINDDVDVSLLMLYGYMLSLGGDHASALNYFMRAYAVNPDNPMINLNIGLAHIHHGLKNQSDDRQRSILQALTFIFRYYDSRKESEHLEERLEAHYNVARTYHTLGLSHLAIPYYQKVLDEAKAGAEEDFVAETAFNLQTLYKLAGNMELARNITREYLVI